MLFFFLNIVSLHSHDKKLFLVCYVVKLIISLFVGKAWDLEEFYLYHKAAWTRS